MVRVARRASKIGHHVACATCLIDDRHLDRIIDLKIRVAVGAGENPAFRVQSDSRLRGNDLSAREREAPICARVRASNDEPPLRS